MKQMSSSLISPSPSFLIELETASMNLRARSERSESGESNQRDAACNLECLGVIAAAIRGAASPPIGRRFIYCQGRGGENFLSFIFFLSASIMIHPDGKF